MPSILKIPSHTLRTCEPCEFHKMTAAMMGQPGNTWREYNCMHPKAFDGSLGEMSKLPEIAAKQGAIRARLIEHGRRIGRTENQPEWCPLKSEPTNERPPIL